MENFKKTNKSELEKVELMSRDRQQKTLREFKEVLQNLILLLREATQADTSYLYWINRSRRQFVLEARSTNIEEIRFQDRVGFDDHYLNEYKDISEPVKLLVGADIDYQALAHYYNKPLITDIMLVPFINNDETVAISVLEYVEKGINLKQHEAIYAYTHALGNMLNTYLEISDLYKDQQEWVNYNKCLSFLDTSGHCAVLLGEMLNTLQSFLPHGSVSLITKGMDRWSTVLNSIESVKPLPLGIPVENRTVASDALKKGEPEFVIHFNNNPKRISPREPYTEGASLAIPMVINDHCKPLVLINDQNPLIFKESTKHKLTNIVRLSALKIQAKNNKKQDSEFLLTNNFGAFIPDIWEQAIEVQIKRLQNDCQIRKTWIGFATLSNISEIRTRFRIEELNCLQKDLIKILNPGQFGISGFVGSHSDYLYLILIQSKNPETFKRWQKHVKEKFNAPFQLSNGKQIETQIYSGFVELDAYSEDAYGVTRQAKNSLFNTQK